MYGDNVIGPCKKCGAADAWREPVRLCGGVHATLCQACRTAFDGHVLGHPLAVQISMLDANFGVLKARLGHPLAVHPDALATLAHERIGLELRLREEVVLPWLAAKEAVA